MIFEKEKEEIIKKIKGHIDDIDTFLQTASTGSQSTPSYNIARANYYIALINAYNIKAIESNKD